MHFDWTVSLGSVVAALSFLGAAGAFWTAQIAAKKDIEWRIANLEAWRKEHMVDADARDKLLTNIDKILFHVTQGREGVR